MKFYNVVGLLYLETDASDVGLGVGLLQVREGMNCLCDEAPDDMALYPIAFTSKSLFSVETRYSTIERKAPDIFYG